MDSQIVRILAVIPARFQSTRLEGKPLLQLGDRTVIRRVWDAVSASSEFDEVVVATDDERILDTVRGFGGSALLTSPALKNGTERVAAAADLLPGDYDVVANIQGDQPFVSRSAIVALLAPFRQGERPDMSTVAMPLEAERAGDPNTVKIVTDLNGRALYFSRSLIPAGARPAGHPFLQHLGLYAYRRDVLREFPTLAPTPLEQAEDLEQLRALEHGLIIATRVAVSSSIEINTPEDLEQARAWIRRHEESSS